MTILYRRFRRWLLWHQEITVCADGSAVTMRGAFPQIEKLTDNVEVED